MSNVDKILKRSEKLAFYGVPSANGGDPAYTRMRGFTELAMSKNPTEYSRKYVDEKTERNDVVGYSPSISFAFDKFSEDAVHIDMVEITDNEATGADAVRSIVIVDTTKQTGDGYYAQKRDFSVIPDSEGNDAEAYTYSGSLKANGEVITGTATTDDNWQTVTFSE